MNISKLNSTVFKRYRPRGLAGGGGDRLARSCAPTDAYGEMVSKLPNVALETEGRAPAVHRLDLDSVAALIFRPDGRYLLQHRENRSDISFPNWWSLFGGARESGERAEDALRRELREELELIARECFPILGCTFESWAVTAMICNERPPQPGCLSCLAL